jgi:alkylhydroperoxidase/carboxymuconolactone decarboxylase family protein YurZ
MDSKDDLLTYYREKLKWHPPFAEAWSKYLPEALEGYLTMRQSVNEGALPKQTVELIFAILDAIDDETDGAKAHAVAAIDAGLTMQELVEAFTIVSIVKGINFLCKSGSEVIHAAEVRSLEKGMSVQRESIGDQNANKI